MTSILDQYPMPDMAWTDADEEKRRALMALTAGLGLLGSRSWRDIPNVGATTLAAYLGAGKQAREDKLAQAEAMTKRLEYAQKMQAFDDAQALRQGLGAVGNVGGDVTDPYQKQMLIADEYERIGRERQIPALLEHALKLRKEALAYRDENAGVETVMVNGRPTLVQKRKFGAPTPVEGMEPKPDIALQNLGGSVQAIDRLRLTGGEQFPVTVDPGAQLSANVSMRGQNMTDARAREANAIASGNKLSANTIELRKEVMGLQPVKDYLAVQPMVASSAQAPDTPAGDLDVIYAVGKVLDPNSVVREGELNLVIKAGSPLQRLEGTVRNIALGKGRLTPEMRSELMTVLASRERELRSNMDRALVPYRKAAADQGLPEQQVFMLGEQARPAPGKTVVRTGTNKKTGKRIVQYSDGSIEER